MKKHIHSAVQQKTDLCQGQQTQRDMSGKYLLYLALSGIKADMDVWKILASQWTPKG